ncbi:hypothetical protein HCN44_001472 [Aphidius gifuensis]|uniref:Peptidase S1 domain-containing protein n=1 Tax=Aphidius gifuensis TaxID=684658 RepID=A0A835CQD6_APHGI|nr:hypothetical protein HCN44_001472 [Aphidius gifuensis]
MISPKVANVPCGQGKLTRRMPKIVGGQDAIPSEFPWLVSITRKGGHFCGGTIINNKFILTAAHCLCSGLNSIPVNQLKVTLGEYNLRETEIPASIIKNIKNVVVHPSHKCGQYIDDIAILELGETIVWSNSIQPACLPIGQDDVNYQIFNGESATAAGWGWLGENRTEYKRTDKLQKVDVNIIENKVCRDWYESQGKKTRVGPQQMCAGHESGGRDSCWADSGGPLMVGSNLGDSIVVVGVVSSGLGCARPKLPGIYTRISEYIPWITQQTNIQH